MKFDVPIPIWEKIAITPEEASILFSIPADFFRVAGQLTKLNAYDLPCVWKGNHLLLNLELLKKWFNEKSYGHEDFKISLIKKKLEEYRINSTRRGRPRKQR